MPDYFGRSPWLKTAPTTGERPLSVLNMYQELVTISYNLDVLIRECADD
jgi:hypothetical protein